MGFSVLQYDCICCRGAGLRNNDYIISGHRGMVEFGQDCFVKNDKREKRY